MTDKPVFEVIDAEEFAKAKLERARGYVTDPRTYTTWYKLPHSLGFCTVPAHEEIQRKLKPDQLEYRQRYPSRMVFQIDKYHVCRDCYLQGADLSVSEEHQRP